MKCVKSFQLSGLRSDRCQILLDRTNLFIRALVVVLLAVVVVAGDVGVLPDGVGSDAGGRVNLISIDLFLKKNVVLVCCQGKLNFAPEVHRDEVHPAQLGVHPRLLPPVRHELQRNMGGLKRYRECLKGSSQVARICGGNVAFSCLQEVNKTQLFHLISHNMDGPFRDCVSSSLKAKPKVVRRAKPSLECLPWNIYLSRVVQENVGVHVRLDGDLDHAQPRHLLKRFKVEKEKSNLQI